eukprot:Clim_evm45s239 gene=Clim_evmTU45s239
MKRPSLIVALLLLGALAAYEVMADTTYSIASWNMATIVKSNEPTYPEITWGYIDSEGRRKTGTSYTVDPACFKSFGHITVPDDALAVVMEVAILVSPSGDGILYDLQDVYVYQEDIFMQPPLIAAKARKKMSASYSTLCNTLENAWDCTLDLSYHIVRDSYS